VVVCLHQFTTLLEGYSVAPVHDWFKFSKVANFQAMSIDEAEGKCAYGVSTQHSSSATTETMQSIKRKTLAEATAMSSKMSRDRKEEERQAAAMFGVIIGEDGKEVDVEAEDDAGDGADGKRGEEEDEESDHSVDFAFNWSDDDEAGVGDLVDQGGCVYSLDVAACYVHQYCISG